MVSAKDHQASTVGEMKLPTERFYQKKNHGAEIKNIISYLSSLLALPLSQPKPDPTCPHLT